MQVNKINLNYNSKADEINIVPLGDIHKGNKGCEIARFREQVRWIQDKPDTYWIGMGDYIDCINYSDPRFDPNTIEDKYLRNLSNCVPDQTYDIIRLLEPIKDKCLGLHRGNHEETIRTRYHYDVLQQMTNELGVPFLGDVALTRISFSASRHKGWERSLDIFSQHGRAGGRKGGNKINWLEDFIGYIDADVYLLAHAHIKESEIKTQLFVDQFCNVKQKKKLLAVTGSFLRGYTKDVGSYVEKWMLPPTDLGVVKIRFKPWTGDLHVSL